MSVQNTKFIRKELLRCQAEFDYWQGSHKKNTFFHYMSEISSNVCRRNFWNRSFNFLNRDESDSEGMTGSVSIWHYKTMSMLIICPKLSMSCDNQSEVWQLILVCRKSQRFECIRWQLEANAQGKGKKLGTKKLYWGQDLQRRSHFMSLFASLFDILWHRSKFLQTLVHADSFKIGTCSMLMKGHLWHDLKA